MKRLLHITLMLFIFFAGFVVGKNQVPHTIRASKSFKSIREETKSGLEMPQVPTKRSRNITKTVLQRPQRKDKGYIFEEPPVEGDEEEEITTPPHEIEMLDQEAQANTFNFIDANLLNEIFYSLQASGMPIEEIENMLEGPLSEDEIESILDLRDYSQEEMEVQFVESLMDAGYSDEEIDNMVQDLIPPTITEDPEMEDGEIPIFNSEEAVW